MAYGVKSILGIRFQNSFDTVPLDADAYEFFEFMSESITEKIPPLKVTGMRGIYDEGETEPGARTIDGDINIESRALDSGVLMKAMFGATLVSSNHIDANSGVFRHVWEPNQTDFDELSAKTPVAIHKHVDTPSSATIFYNMNANMIEWGLANGDFLKTKLSFVGGTRIQLSPDVATYKTGRRFTWDQTSISLDGVANCDFRELTITVDDSLEAQHTLCNSPYPSRIKRTDFRKITIGATLVFKDETEVAAFRAQSERALIISNRGKVDISSGSATNLYEELTIEMPAMRYTEVDPAASAPGSLELSVTADIKYHVNSATAMRMILTNTANITAYD